MAKYHVSIPDEVNKELFEDSVRAWGGSIVEIIGDERELVDGYRKYYEGKFRDDVEGRFIDLEEENQWLAWEALGYDVRVQFTNIVDMYHESPDYMSPAIGHWVYENELENFLESCTLEIKQ